MIFRFLLNSELFFWSMRMKEYVQITKCTQWWIIAIKFIKCYFICECFSRATPVSAVSGSDSGPCPPPVTPATVTLYVWQGTKSVIVTDNLSLVTLMFALPSSVVHVIVYWLKTPLISEGCSHVTRTSVGPLGEACTAVGALGAGTQVERFDKIKNYCFSDYYIISKSSAIVLRQIICVK